MMPKKAERKLKREAKKLYPDDPERQDTYVYGTMNKLGLDKKQKKHDSDEHEYRD